VIVVDANLLVYFWSGGQGARLAQAVLRRDPMWSAPLLWRSEFRNVVLKLIRGRDLSVAQAIMWAREAELQMLGREYSVESHVVLALAVQSGCSAYDCEYVALAQDLDVRLVTFDEQVSEAFRDRAIAPESFVRD
jgi:predicted nucleic acid-binding protein